MFSRPPMLRRATALLLAGALAVTCLVSPALADPRSFIQSLWPEAKARGVSQSVFEAALGNFSPSQQVLDLTKKQPEFSQTVAQYLSKRVTGTQVQTGRAMAGEWSKTLAAVSKAYGVQPEVILAIWGIETNFGGYMGSTNTFTALATLVYGGYRPDYFKGELLMALQIADAGHARPRDMIGSWAGAMGHTQFMPTSFASYAVDHNGDGRTDIWGSIPDALASTANYLTKHGWRPGETWGYEIRMPAGFDFTRAWTGDKLTVADWQRLGITRANGKPFPRPSDVARLYVPTGGAGPAFLLLPNFEVIKRYNNSDSYALTVGALADRIIGSNGFVAPWPEDTALSKTERQQVQSLLARHGFDVGSPDGVIGPKTRAAIMTYQAQLGLIPDGWASGRLLQYLQRG